MGSADAWCLTRRFICLLTRCRSGLVRMVATESGYRRAQRYWPGRQSLGPATLCHGSKPAKWLAPFGGRPAAVDGTHHRGYLSRSFWLCQNQTIRRTAIAALRRSGFDDHTAGMSTKNTITTTRTVAMPSAQYLLTPAKPARQRIAAVWVTLITGH